MPYQPDLQLPATTPGGLATGVNGERLAAPPQAAADKIKQESEKKAEEDKEAKTPITLKLTAPTGATAKSTRYPIDLQVDKNTDYVRFDFFTYVPPFGKDNPLTSGGADTESLSQYNFNAFGNAAKGEKSNFKSAGLPSIALYMPEDVSTGYKTNWTGKNFSNIGSNLIQSYGGEGIAGKLTGLAESAEKATQNFTSIAGAQVLMAAISKITGESVTLDDIFGSTRGVILNPNTELMFGGLDLRTFNLVYKLVPRSQKEADSIENIIKTFKMAMLPYANSGATDLKDFFNKDLEAFSTAQNNSFQTNYIKVPDVCQVSFMRGGTLNPHVPQYKMCALVGVDINYTPDGAYATTRDGRMVAYQLTLSFQETKLIFREDVKGGYF